MTEALARARPQIDDPEELERVLNRLIEAYDPVAVFLYGSRARREAWLDSDYDLMLVLPDDAPPARLAPSVWWDVARSDHIEANVVFSRASSYQWRRHAVGTLEYEVEVDGVQLYPTAGPAFVAARSTKVGTAVVEVVREWLEQVERDLDAATDCIHGPKAVPDRAAFHVQQAAEKLAKAALVAHRVRPEHTHQIPDVVAQLPEAFALKRRCAALHRFSSCAVGLRYPGRHDLQIPSATEVDAWITEIEALKADFERWLAEREMTS